MKKYVCVVFFMDTRSGTVIDCQLFWLAASGRRQAASLARWAWRQAAKDNQGTSRFAGEVIDLKKYSIESVDVYTVGEFAAHRRAFL